MKRDGHYLLLDAARWIAAMAVLLFHIRQVLPHAMDDLGSHFLSHSYLAVDLFFLMSGLVIARAYEGRMREGTLSWQGFCWVRFVRLWPLYILGMLLGFIYACVKPYTMAGGPSPGVAHALVTFLFNSVFVPDLTSQGEMFPHNPPAWSLCFEVAINLLYAMVAVRWPTRVLGGIVVASAVVLLLVALPGRSMDMGVVFATAAGGALRIVFSFTLGVVMYRRMSAVTVRLPALLAPVWLAGITALLMTPFAVPGLLYDGACVLLAMPALVALACFTRTPAGMGGLFAWLGQISYPIYILQVPLLFWFNGAYKVWTHAASNAQGHLGTPVLAGAIVASAAVAYAVYDRPVRAMLGPAWRRRMERAVA